MHTASKKIRIKDIARMAGVSEGTVDRVLHNRKEVSAKSRAKVEAVLQEIQYQPNLYATALASKKRYTFAAILPEVIKGEYWEEVKNGIEAALQELQDLNIDLIFFHYRQYDCDSYATCLETVRNQTIEGVIWVPAFREESEATWKYWDKQEIPYLFIDSEIISAHPISFLGMDSFRSGFLAAKLLLESVPNPLGEIALLYANHHPNTRHNQTILRRAGFMEFLLRRQPDLIIHDWSLSSTAPDKNSQTLHQLMQEHPGVVAAATFNSRAFLFAEELQKIAQEKGDPLRIIGYDLLPENVLQLKKKNIQFLIAQRPYEQGYRAIKELCNHTLFKRTPPRHIYVPIDILTQENVDYYLQYK